MSGAAMGWVSRARASWLCVLLGSVLAGAPISAQATGCALEFLQNSPITVSPGSATSLDLAVTDAIPGTCSNAAFLVSTLSDSTEGTIVSPTGGNIDFGDPPEALVVQAPALGGGSFVFQVICEAGCENATNPNPIFTVNVGTDVYAMSFFSPTGGSGFIFGGGNLDLSVLLARNGMPGELGPGEGLVCFELPFDQNPMGASLTGGTGPCGSGGRLADADVNGVATVTLVGTANMCAMTRVTATAVGFPSPQSLSFDVTGLDPLDILTVSGSAQQAVAQTPFPQPLVARLQCGTGSPTIIAGVPVRFDRLTGESAVISGGLTSAVLITDAKGEANVDVAATSLPGGTTFRACPDFDVFCDASTTFDLTTLGVTTPGLSGITPSLVEVAPGASAPLQAQATNNSLPASGVTVAWSTAPGGATLSSTETISDDTGLVQNIATVPASTGLWIVRAERADSPGVIAEFEVESVQYAMSVGTLPVGEVGVPLVFGVGVQRQGATTALVPSGLISFSILDGPSEASLTALDDSQIIDNRARFSLEAFVPGIYTVRAQYAPPSGLPPVFVDLPIEFAGGVFGEFEMRFAAPGFQLYSDETSASGLVVSVSGPGQSGQVPLTDFPVDIAITSGNASFLDSGSAFLGVTNSSGQLTTPPIMVGSNLGSVRVTAGFKGTVLAEIDLEIRRSEYVLEFIAPDRDLVPGSPVTIGVALTRSGALQGGPLSGSRIEWSARGAALESQVSVTGIDGRAFNRLTVDAKSDVHITARFLLADDSLGGLLEVALSSGQVGLEVVSGSGQQAPPGQFLPNPVVLRALRDGAAQPGVPVRLLAEPAAAAAIDPGSVITDNLGEARFRVRVNPSAPATFRLIAQRDDAPQVSAEARASSSEPPAQRDLRVVSGGGQRTPPGTVFPAPLVVEATNDEQPVAGVPVFFSVVPEGAAEVTPSSQGVTSESGRLQVQVRLAADAPSTIQVIARRTDTQNAEARFELFAGAALERRLEIVSGSSQTGVVGTRAQPLTVSYAIDGAPAASARVQWDVLSGAATLDATSSLTDAQGRASIGLLFGAEAGEVRVRASVEDIDVVFMLRSVSPTLQIVAGNNQQGLAGQALPELLRVRVGPEPVAGLLIEWRVSSGGGNVDPTSSVTDANGEATAVWTMGDEPGPQTLTARLAGAVNAEFQAVAEGVGDGTLRILSGDNQRLVPGIASEPLIVEAISGTGRPLSGVQIRWSAPRGVLLGDELSSTDAEGQARIRVRLDLPGEARVRAEAVNTDVAVEFVINGAIAESPGATGRRRTVAEALDASCDALSRMSNLTSQQQDLLDRCRELSDAAGSDGPATGRALEQLPNDVGLSLARAGDESVRGQVQNVDQRLRTLRGERTGAGGNRLQLGLGVATPGGVLPVTALPGMALAVDSEALEREIGEGFERWGAFLTGSIGRGRSRANSDALRFDYRLGSITAGVDYRLSDRLVLGAALGYSRDETEFAAGRGTLDSSGTSVSAFASFWLPQSWYVDANVSAGRNSFELERTLAYSLVDRSGTTRRIDQRAWADTDARLLGGSLSAGRDWQRRSLNIGSYVRAQFSRVDYDAFEERMLTDRPGSGFALRVESPAWNSLEGVLGVRGSWAVSRDWGVLMPNFMLEYSHEFRDDPSRLDMRFVADPTGSVFSQSGASIDNSHVNLGLGTSILLPGGRSGFIQYERRLFDDRISHWLLSIGGRFEF